jgi:hypothetical protein
MLVSEEPIYRLSGIHVIFGFQDRLEIVKKIFLARFEPGV